MKKALLLGLGTLLIPLVHALSGTVIYTDFVYSGDSIEVTNNLIIDVYHFYDEDRENNPVLITAENKSYLINKGQCQHGKLYEYCITEIIKDLNHITDRSRDGKSKFNKGVWSLPIGLKVLRRAKEHKQILVSILPIREFRNKFIYYQIQDFYRSG